MYFYVSIANVDIKALEILGYYVVAEDDDTIVISHFGTETIVDKADPFLYVDDINDVQLIKNAGEIIGVPKK